MATIFDIGMYDGCDTAYYLSRGYSVIAVEARPDLVQRAARRFADEIAAGQLIILNVAIAESNGEKSFWVCDDFPVWSSLNKAIASRDDASCHPIEVKTVTFETILKQFGAPHYLKVDIESADHLCIRDLKGQRNLPTYISVETECIGSNQYIAEEAFLENIHLLNRAGYTRYKLVNQQTLMPINHINLKSAFQRHTIEQHKKELDQRCHWNFCEGSSGPWGEDIAGPWMTFGTACKLYCALREMYFRKPGRPLYSFWLDWHARIGSASVCQLLASESSGSGESSP